jgi:hypothetical protein
MESTTYRVYPNAGSHRDRELREKRNDGEITIEP